MATIYLSKHESAVILAPEPETGAVKYNGGVDEHTALATTYDAGAGQVPYTEDELVTTYNAVKTLIINHGTSNIYYTIPGDPDGNTPDSDLGYSVDSDGDWVAPIGNAPQRPSAPPVT
jgi:hypothetical protein